MIVVTRLNDSRFAVNPDLIERIHEVPDTTLIMVDGAKYVVTEPMADVIDMIARYRARIVALAYDEPALPAPTTARTTGPQLGLVRGSAGDGIVSAFPAAAQVAAAQAAAAPTAAAPAPSPDRSRPGRTSPGRSPDHHTPGALIMDPATIIGILLAFGALFGMIKLEGVHVEGLLLPAPMLLVFGATIAVGIAGTTLKDSIAAFKAIPRAFTGKVIPPQSVIDDVVALAEKARSEGLLSLEAEAEKHNDPFFEGRPAEHRRRHRRRRAAHPARGRDRVAGRRRP